mgnify:CR=1 FL=1
MTNKRILVAALAAGLLTYGGLVGGEAVITGGLSGQAADEAVVTGTTVHLDRSGRPTAVGEVRNQFGEPITNVTVTVSFYRDGELVDERSRQALRGTVPAGESAPFDIRLDSEGEVDRVETSVAFDRGGAVLDGLVVTDKEVAHESQDQVDVTATITNRADRALILSSAIATFYDDRRAVIGARTERPTRRIEPGESYTVRISFRTLGDVPSYARDFERFDVSVVAERAE